MKTSLRSALFVSALLIVPFVVIGQSVTVNIGETTAAAGGLATVPITISGGAGPYAGVQLDIVYPSPPLSNPSCEPGPDMIPVTTSHPSSPPTDPGKDRLRLLVFDIAELTTFGDGPIAGCTFEVDAEATGVQVLEAENAGVSDPDSEEIPATGDDGSISIGTVGCF